MAKKASFSEKVKEELTRKSFTSREKQYNMEKRAYLRDAFLRTGSMSDPAKAYHLEFVCESAREAEKIRELLEVFGIRAGEIDRAGHSVVYLKSGEDIAELLSVMGAHVGLMEMENSRIYKDMRNKVNRRVNCDAANIAKSVRASSKQIEAIRLLQESGVLGKLEKGLREAAKVRMAHPDATIGELASYMKPPLTKSGMNHRLQKLQVQADTLRTQSAGNR
ncbi:MAG: DNA-binding protein WhiA [Lachnospiraceae bacterium]|nr:DNA-binding protein WhiA [Lachnospiraceae bacterium]